MLSKNNKKQYLLKHTNGKQHFALRKTTIGLASVLLSTTLYLGSYSNNPVQAAENNANANDTSVVTDKAVDKSALQTAYDNALNVQKSDVKYTNETDAAKKSAYDSAITAAKTVLDNASATGEDVTNAVNNLQVAYSNLKGVEKETNTVELSSLTKTNVSADALKTSLVSNSNEDKKTTANDTAKTGSGLYSDEDRAKQQASSLTEAATTISKQLSTEFLKSHDATQGDRYVVDPKNNGVFPGVNGGNG
ncbi:YSIRK-type signal peptide-containing protein [Lactobacillus psittaci]|uniref:Extracellular matrix-binding protein ebh n=1 Tax=Lactobacillus psittaci DSM 15354 TaxID=1122152 RepID=A0A0R1S390_9LACO|nr:YSIRK-type signal peptide-containing protein [Lactobacillus psittaci]KRL63686.1 extracellular matrix-binding protein ebh [Lactobacillus psittaci DSM 15354]